MVGQIPCLDLNLLKVIKSPLGVEQPFHETLPGGYYFFDQIF